MEAIRYGDQPEVRARLTQKIDHAFDHDHLKSLLDRSALAQETMSPDRLFEVKEEMERAEARRLQPFFVRSFFLKAFDQLGGTIHRREAGTIRDHPRSRRDSRTGPPAHRPQPPRAGADPEAVRPHRLHPRRPPAARQAGPRPRRADAPRPPADARPDRHDPRTERQPAPAGGRSRRSGRRHRSAVAAVPADARGEVRRRGHALETDAVHPREPGRLRRVRRLGTAPRPRTAGPTRIARCSRTC